MQGSKDVATQIALVILRVWRVVVRWVFHRH